MCYLSGFAMLYTVPTTYLSTGACQAGWVSGASWKTLATQAPVLAEAFARVQWWRALPGSPVVVPVASEVKGWAWVETHGRQGCGQSQLTLSWFFQAQTAPSQIPASAAPVLMAAPAQWGQMADLPVPAHLATRVTPAEVT